MGVRGKTHRIEFEVKSRALIIDDVASAEMVVVVVEEEVFWLWWRWWWRPSNGKAIRKQSSRLGRELSMV